MSNPHDRERVTAIVEKVEFVEECLTTLATKQSVSFEEYLDSTDTQDIVERRFEKATR